MQSEATTTPTPEFQGVKLTERRLYNFYRRIGGGTTPSHMPHLGPCHEWQGPKHHSGYGNFIVRGRRCDGPKYILAHRLAYFLHHGSIPSGMNILHHCDNRRCTRISHLFPGTQKDNGEDMAKKGRSGSLGGKAWQRRFPDRVPRGAAHYAWGKDGRKGEAHPFAKLDDKRVLEILSMYATGNYSYSQIAPLFNVCAGTIQQIVQRKIWSHIEFSGNLMSKVRQRYNKPKK